MFHGVNLVITWYIASLAVLTLAPIFLLYASVTRQVPTPIKPAYQMYKSLPSISHESTNQVITLGDGRPVLVEKFFRFHKAPLADFSAGFIKAADQYGIDFRLLPSIAMQESNGGRKMPKGSFNPFGYGIYRDRVLKFNSFEEAIEKVAWGIKKNYLEQGLKTPEEIMTKYTPPSLQKGGAWALGVSAFMEQLR